MSTTLTRTVCCKREGDGHDAALAATQCTFNVAATGIARVCWDAGIATTHTAHHRVYGETRERFGVGAQLAVCARATVGEASTAVKAKRRATCPTFGPRGSVRDDARTYRLMSLDRVALNTLEGRVVCRLVLGPRQHEMRIDPSWEIGGADLVWRAGMYDRHVPPSREAPAQAAPDGGTLGVELGIANLATDREGEHVSGAVIHLVRARDHLRRQRLQNVGTRTVKRRIRRIRRMGQHEARFQRDINHCISKKLVHKAVVSCTALARDELSGIRERTPVRHEHRDERHSWAFFHLRQHITDKAAGVGVPVCVVDPRNTSRTCSRCGPCEQATRRSHAEFLCQNPLCRQVMNADHNAAQKNQPSGPQSVGLWRRPSRGRCKPPALAVRF
jgi:IS605 OrfB family transposase